MANIKGVGIDIIEISRFKPLIKNHEHHFIKRNFTRQEIEYCFSFKDPQTHFAGTFAAKEAVFKCLGENDILQSSIEILRGKNGRPYVCINKKTRKNIFVSISHSRKNAIAIAICQ